MSVEKEIEKYIINDVFFHYPHEPVWDTLLKQIKQCGNRFDIGGYILYSEYQTSEFSPSDIEYILLTKKKKLSELLMKLSVELK